MGELKKAPSMRIMDSSLSLDTVNSDDDATWAEADDAAEEASARQQLQIIKARTMYDMVDQLKGDYAARGVKMVFLTNKQVAFFRIYAIRTRNITPHTLEWLPCTFQ